MKAIVTTVMIVVLLGGSTALSQATQNGDVNCDGVINIRDMQYIVKYLFAGGPPPCEIAPDTILMPLKGEWLRFSAYQASKEFVLENYPEYTGFRFSSIGAYCDYNADTPAGRAGFRMNQDGDSLYTTGGYLFEHVFGAEGFVWGAVQNQPTERTYWYSCNIRLESDGTWSLLDISSGQAGSYIRDTRHD